MCKWIAFYRNGLFAHTKWDCKSKLFAEELKKLIPTLLEVLTELGRSQRKKTNLQKHQRPFDKNRDGLVPSGGGATVILESLESAQARGANILAESCWLRIQFKRRAYFQPK